jgi:hypothetical protein
MNCDACLLSPELKLLQAEDNWITHCERMLKYGSRATRFEKLPDFIKTDRIKKFYEGYEIRVKNKKNE